MGRLINCKDIAGGQAVLDGEKEKPRLELRAPIYNIKQSEESRQGK